MLIYLLEIRRRLIHSLMCFGLWFMLCFYFANDLYLLLVQPLLQRLPQHSQLIATNVTAAIFTPLHLATNLALLLTMPMILWQLWKFVSPGLYPQEKAFLRSLLWISQGLFLCGVAFAYIVVLPYLYSFFIYALPSGVQLMPDIRQTLDFSLRMLLLFGLSFQVPLLCALLVQMRLVSVKQLQVVRPYMIVSAFIVGMLLTPPDVLSQCMLAIPLCLLYEVGIIAARRIERGGDCTKTHNIGNRP